jgi:hypothetical protein
MGRILRRRVALSVALAAILAGGTAVALGATTAPKHTRGARQTRTHVRGEKRLSMIGAASSYLGLSPAQIAEQLHQGKSLAQLAAATPGKTEAGLIAAMTEAVKSKIPTPPADLEARVKAIVNRTPGTELARHARLGGRRHGALRAAVLSYLGMTRHQLIKELKTGKTIAQVADSTPGKSAAGLTEVLLATFKGKLDATVAAHELTKSDESAHLTLFKARVSRLLAQTHVGLHHPHTGTPAPGA